MLVEELYITVGVLLYYNSKDITMSSVCLIRRRKNPALHRYLVQKKALQFLHCRVDIIYRDLHF
jgi:hypothetical protein